MIGSDRFRSGRVGRRRARAAVRCLAALAAAAHATAEPYVPGDDAQVLERLPARAGPEWRAVAVLQADLARAPGDSRTAVELARRYLGRFRRQGDPRLVGYAQRALAPWAASETAPVEVALARAEIAQTEHRFEAAREELEHVIAREPHDGRAWLALASIDVVRADYAAARRECARLVLLEDASVAGGCIAAVQAMSGEAGQAADLLERQLADANALPEGIAAWLETLAAEIAEARGRGEDAERHYRAALAVETEPSVYLLAARADFLLRAQRPAEVVELLRDAPSADALLLRLALAEKLAGRDVGERVGVLEFRLALALEGLDHTHAREAAYLALYLLERPALALETALANWAVQREPVDARLVLEAAIAARRPEAARAVVEWLAANRVEHVDLRGLALRARVTG
jgi:hypothetical protein